MLLVFLLQNKKVWYLKHMLHDRVDAATSSILMCKGEILKDNTKLSEYPGVIDGAKLILQRQLVEVDLYDCRGHFIFHSPQVIYFYPGERKG